ncbi:tRNA(Glu)-specific nuclease WapA precursor [compost metagenome]
MYNGHGDVVQVIDENGTVVNKYQYDEWGNILQQEEKVPNSFKYAGELQDEETGLYYLRARYYDPSVGRFISKDTYEGDVSNPLSLNLYSYTNNNPLGKIDPSGHLPVNPDLWKANLAINQQKIAYEAAVRANDRNAMNKASSIANELRRDYLNKAKKLGLSTEGLLSSKDGILAYHDIVSEDKKVMRVAVSNKGKVFYQADLKNYKYYEEVHSESNIENKMGTVAKAATGYLIGYLLGKAFKKPSKSLQKAFSRTWSRLSGSMAYR